MVSHTGIDKVCFCISSSQCAEIVWDRSAEFGVYVSWEDQAVCNSADDLLERWPPILASSPATRYQSLETSSLQQRQALGSAITNLPDDGQGGGVLEWALQGYQLIHDTSKRENVGRVARSCGQNNLTVPGDQFLHILRREVD